MQETKAADKPFVVDYYYKAKWGYADEFIRLFTKNHYPVLKKQRELGRILEVSVVKPRYHVTEDGRWDYRVTIVFKSGRVATEDFDEGAITKEEQRRFEILQAHWDLPITPVDPEKKQPLMIAAFHPFSICRLHDQPVAARRDVTYINLAE